MHDSCNITSIIFVFVAVELFSRECVARVNTFHEHVLSKTEVLPVKSFSTVSVSGCASVKCSRKGARVCFATLEYADRVCGTVSYVGYNIRAIVSRQTAWTYLPYGFHNIVLLFQKQPRLCPLFHNVAPVLFSILKKNKLTALQDGTRPNCILLRVLVGLKLLEIELPCWFVPPH